MGLRTSSPVATRERRNNELITRLARERADLLAALERLNASADWIELQVLQKDARGYSLAKELEQARAAIAKAKGEAR